MGRRFKFKRATLKNGGRRSAFNDFSCIDSRHIYIRRRKKFLAEDAVNVCRQVVVDLSAELLVMGCNAFTGSARRCRGIERVLAKELENLRGPKEL